MNANARLWVEALESGEYKQTTGQLRVDDKFCCLGVACDLYAKQNKLDIDNDVVSGRTRYFYDGNRTQLPPIVKDWLGLRSDIGSYDDETSLAEKNDAEYSFKEIAEIIKSEPKGLFV